MIWLFTLWSCSTPNADPDPPVSNDCRWQIGEDVGAIVALSATYAGSEAPPENTFVLLFSQRDVDEWWSSIPWSTPVAPTIDFQSGWALVVGVITDYSPACDQGKRIDSFNWAVNNPHLLVARYVENECGTPCDDFTALGELWVTPTSQVDKCKYDLACE